MFLEILYQHGFSFIFLVMWELKESGIFMGRGTSHVHTDAQHNLYIRTNDVLHTSDLIFWYYCLEEGRVAQLLLCPRVSGMLMPKITGRKASRFEEGRQGLMFMIDEAQI